MHNEKYINTTLNEKEFECFDAKIKMFSQPFEMARTNDRLRLNILDGKGSFVLFDDYNDLFKFVTNGTKIESGDLWELYEKTKELNNKILKEDAQIGNKKLENFTFDKRELKFFEECLDENLYNHQEDIICLAKKDNFMYEISGNKERKIGFCPNSFNFLDEKGTNFYIGALLECYEKSDLYWTEMDRKNALKKIKLTEDEMHFVDVLLCLFDENSNIWIDRTIYGDLTISEDCVENEFGSIFIPKCNNLFSFIGFDKDVFSINLQELVELYENQVREDDENLVDYDEIAKFSPYYVYDENTEHKIQKIQKIQGTDFDFLKIKSEELESKANEWIELWQSYNKDSQNNDLLGITLRESFKDLNMDLKMLYHLSSTLSYFNFIDYAQLFDIMESFEKIGKLLSDFQYVNDLIF